MQAYGDDGQHGYHNGLGQGKIVKEAAPKETCSQNDEPLDYIEFVVHLLL